MTKPKLAVVAWTVLPMLLVAAPQARAEVSPQDGFAPDGKPQVHVEVEVFGWLPATSAAVKLGNGANAGVSTGVPSVSSILNVLTGAFFGDALVRYGRWSAELDGDYVGLKASKDLPPGPLDLRTRTLTTNVTLTRVAPGVGYEVYNGGIGQVPVTLDARAGFSWFQASTTLDLDADGESGRDRLASVTGTSVLVQPWAGLRASFYPGSRWRIELTAALHGFGVDGGTWGWQAGGNVTYAVNNWFNVVGGIYAQNTQTEADQTRAVKSLNITNWGPMLGVGFTF